MQEQLPTTAGMREWRIAGPTGNLPGPSTQCSRRMALRATLASPRLVGRLQRNILFRVASLIHPWISDPVACAALSIL